MVTGDVSEPGLGLATEVRERLAHVDLIVNSGGLTDFNPDLRDALATNLRATAHILDLLRNCDHAACCTYRPATWWAAQWASDRTLAEELYAARCAGFPGREGMASAKGADAETEARGFARSSGRDTAAALEKEHAAKNLQGAALENQIRKNRVRWLRQTMMDAGCAGPTSWDGRTPTR